MAPADLRRLVFDKLGGTSASRRRSAAHARPNMRRRDHTDTHAAKPVLFLDVDGVISLFGIPEDQIDEVGPLHWIDGVAHYIPPELGGRLIELAEHFELVWATGWENMANRYLPAILGLPFHELPSLVFGGRAVFGSSDWKLDALSDYAGTRPAAWIDDNIDEACRLWAMERGAPTLLVHASASMGLTDEHVSELIAWAELVAPDERGSEMRAETPPERLASRRG